MTQRLLLVVLLLGGCTEMMEQPTREELDWNPPTLSKTGCPDLSGRYVAPDYLHYDFVFPVGIKESLYKSWEMTQRDKHLPIQVVVKSQADGILVQADNGRNRVELFTAYDGVNVGCDKGVLVSRFVSPLRTPGESGGCTRLNYGERRLQRYPSGDLSAEESHRNRCSNWGSLTSKPPSKESTMGPFIFRRVK
jgi:hypothetical protein